MIIQNSKTLKLSYENYPSRLFKLFYELPATLKCLFLTLQGFLKDQDRKFKTEGNL